VRQYQTFEGDRPEIVAQLERWRDHWRTHRDRQQECADALAAVQAGATDVWAVGTRYLVVEDDLGEPERNPDQAAINAERDVRIAAVQDGLDEG
jgi:hypothetical protein